MKLTRKKAIELCIELWTKLAKTGNKLKSRAIRWIDYITIEEARDGQYCWFCIYNNRRSRRPQATSDCSFACPYYNVYGFCCEGKTFYSSWLKSKTREDRKKYAKLFLAQIQTLEK